MASWQTVGYKVHWIRVSISIATALYNRTNSARCHKREPGYGIGVRYLWCQFVNVSGVWISICVLLRAATRTNDQVLHCLKVNEKKVHILSKRIVILRQLHHSCTLMKIEYGTDGEINRIWTELGSKEYDQRNSRELFGNWIDGIFWKRTSCGKFWAAWWICSGEHVGSYEGFMFVIDCLLVYLCPCDCDKCENLMDCVYVCT